MQEPQVLSLDQEDPLEKEMATPPVFLLGNPMDRGAWWATVHRSQNSQTQLTTKQQQQIHFVFFSQ